MPITTLSRVCELMQKNKTTNLVPSSEGLILTSGVLSNQTKP